MTLFATLATGTFTHMYHPLIILFYLFFLWILPMWSYTLGLKKKNSCLLFPWVLVFGVHAVVLEFFLLGAACETFLVHVVGVNTEDLENKPIIVIFDTFLDFFILLFLALPLPILLSVPVKAFVYMDITRRQRISQTNDSSTCSRLCCCKSEKQEDTSDISPDMSEQSEVDEEAPEESSSQAPSSSSFIITRFQRLNQQNNIMTTVIRERFANTDAQIDQRNASEDTNNQANITSSTVPVTLRFPSLYDLTSINEDIAETEDSEVSPTDIEDTHDCLPPSYSQAEGLDELPSYSEVEVSRVRFGPYVMVYDKGQNNVLTFKK